MTQVLEPTRVDTPVDTDDLTAAIHRVLQASSEPLTLPKIRSLLPTQHRQANLEEVLRRQVAANVLYQYPKYRSPQDRFWDRPMRVHIVALIRGALQDGSLGWTELRRKLPAYAQPQAEELLREQLDQRQLHVHPRLGSRGSERYGLNPADARDYLRSEMSEIFNRLEKLGFSQAQIRAGALELLHDEEWAPAQPEARKPAESTAEQPRSETASTPTSQASPAMPSAQAAPPRSESQPAAREQP